MVDVVAKFPAGTDLKVVEDYLEGKTPKFIVSRPKELVDKFIRQISRRNVDYYCPHLITDLVVETIQLKLKSMREVATYVDQWNKSSVFWLNYHYEDSHYLFMALLARPTDLYDVKIETPRTPGGWVTRSQIYKTFAEDDTIDLIKEQAEQGIDPYVRKAMVEIGMSIVAYVTDTLLNCPHEVRVSRGIRTKLDVARNKQAIVTVSLSEPVLDYSNRNPNPIPSGIRMPEHDVKGFWRTSKSGKTSFIEAYTRGDPNVPRKTIKRIIP